MSKTVYFDNNATTQVAPEVREAMMPFFGELYGNPSSMHAFAVLAALSCILAAGIVGLLFYLYKKRIF